MADEMRSRCSTPALRCRGIAALLVLALLTAAACHRERPETSAADHGAVVDATAFTLHPLDEKNAAAFRRVFDDARAHDRYIAALSPT